MLRFSFYAIILLASTAVNAQDPKFGLKAGLNLATVTNRSAELKAGFHIGALAHVHLTPGFSLQPEILYSEQGAKFGTDTKLQLNYLNIPLLLQYNFDNGFRLQGGPQLGFLIDPKTKTGDLTIDQSANYKSVDLSLPLGVSYLGYSGFGVDARYNIGLTNTLENTSIISKNSVIQIGLFYLFDHHHKARSK